MHVLQIPGASYKRFRPLSPGGTAFVTITRFLTYCTENCRQKPLAALVVQDPFRMGFEAVKTLVDKLNGITPPKQIDLPARVVTKADLDKPEIHELLYPDVKKYLGSS